MAREAKSARLPWHDPRSTAPVPLGTIIYPKARPPSLEDDDAARRPLRPLGSLLPEHPIHADYAAWHAEGAELLRKLRGSGQWDPDSAEARHAAYWAGLTYWPTQDQPRVVAAYDRHGLGSCHAEALATLRADTAAARARADAKRDAPRRR